MTLGETMEKLGSGFGVIVPANVPHALANTSGERMTVIEFHTVRRADLVPPRPAITFPKSDAPASLSRQIIHRMDGPIWESPFSAMWQRGETCLLAWRRLQAGTGRVELRAGSVERFVYLVRGRLTLTSAAGANRSPAARSSSCRRAPPSRFSPPVPSWRRWRSSFRRGRRSSVRAAVIAVIVNGGFCRVAAASPVPEPVGTRVVPTGDISTRAA